MNTSIVPSTATAIAMKTAPASAQRFDTSILAGNVAESSLEQYRMHFRAYCAFAGSFDAAMEARTLAQWRQSLYSGGYATQAGAARAYSVNAINQRLAAVRRLMVEAAEQGYITHESAEQFRHVKGLSLKANKERRKPHARMKMTEDDIRAILEAPNRSTLAGKMHYALLMTLATSGVRISVVCNLRAAEIQLYTNEDGVTSWVIEAMGKNQSEPVMTELGYRAKAAINEWLEARTAAGIESEYVFTSFAGKGDSRATDRPISRISAWQMVKRYADAAGLSHIKPHDFRRFVGTRLAKSDIRLAQKQLGHKRIETTAQHYILDDVQLGHVDDLF